MKLDILAFSPSDDVELGCSGTILKPLGKKVGFIDLTRELGTRGSAEIRDQEANAAAKILGVSVRKI
jgi:LmbE family N-acetylglucosaminyl deacetylase